MQAACRWSSLCCLVFLAGCASTVNTLPSFPTSEGPTRQHTLLLPASLEVRSIDGLGQVTVDLGGGVSPIVVDVTEATPDQLGLVRGQEIFLVIKATSCRLYGPRG